MAGFPLTEQLANKPIREELFPMPLDPLTTITELFSVIDNNDWNNKFFK